MPSETGETRHLEMQKGCQIKNHPRVKSHDISQHGRWADRRHPRGLHSGNAPERLGIAIHQPSKMRATFRKTSTICSILIVPISRRWEAGWVGITHLVLIFPLRQTPLVLSRENVKPSRQTLSHNLGIRRPQTEGQPPCSLRLEQLLHVEAVGVHEVAELRLLQRRDGVPQADLEEDDAERVDVVHLLEVGRGLTPRLRVSVDVGGDVGVDGVVREAGVFSRVFESDDVRVSRVRGEGVSSEKKRMLLLRKDLWTQPTAWNWKRATARVMARRSLVSREGFSLILVVSSMWRRGVGGEKHPEGNWKTSAMAHRPGMREKPRHGRRRARAEWRRLSKTASCPMRVKISGRGSSEVLSDTSGSKLLISMTMCCPSNLPYETCFDWPRGSRATPTSSSVYQSCTSSAAIWAISISLLRPSAWASVLLEPRNVLVRNPPRGGAQVFKNKGLDNGDEALVPLFSLANGGLHATLPPQHPRDSKLAFFGRR